MLSHFALTVFSIFLFLYGFFPVHQNNAGEIVDIPTTIDEFNISLNETYSEHFDRVVLIVIDALRNDFLTPENLPFTSNKVKEKGCILDVKVECPTVTLPRIKSLTTGSIPQFIDVVLNLGDSGSLKESLLHVLKRSGKNIVFYGDDTWLKLFKDIFIRSEGTTSFFVNDFFEVDTNVTKNLEAELSKNDWHMLILHYLGLDHIGHVYGPRSSLIPEKLKEMDNVIRLIYTELMINSPKTLILITGDHGMKDSGGHGGSTHSETHVPLVVLGTTCQNDDISQTDIAVNLAVLLGAQIPSTSIGLVKKSLLSILTTDEILFAVRYNTFSLLSKTNVCHDHFELATKYHALYLQSKDKELAEKTLHLYNNCSVTIQKVLIAASVEQNIILLCVSIMNLLCIFLMNLSGFNQKNEYQNYNIVIFVVANILRVFLSDLIFFIMCVLIVIINIVSVIRYVLKTHFNVFQNTLIDYFVIVMIILHPFTLAASSFVEEEHQYWYFAFTTMIFLYIINLTKSFSLWQFFQFGLLFLIRFARSINQTGDKWSSLPDLADFFLEKEHRIYLLIFSLSSMIAILYLIFVVEKPKYYNTLINICVCICLFCSYIFAEQKILIEKITWYLILFQIFLTFAGHSSFVNNWISIIMLLLQPYNLFLIVVCLSVSFLLCYKNRNVLFITIAHIFLGNALYFMQGHSNSLASVDISVGYTGLSSYNLFLVAAQVLFHTYAFPVLCHLLFLKQLPSHSATFWLVLFLNRLLIIIVFFIVAVIERHHLFVWSVFAPKILIESCHFVVLFVEVLIYNIVNQFYKIYNEFKKIKR